MGYTTEFAGAFDIAPAPSPELAEYVNSFSCTRHMMRDVEKLKEADPDWEKHCLEGDLGPDGLYYIPASSGKTTLGEIFDGTVVDCNRPPEGAPGLWCQWIVEDGQLMWDGGEKFYAYREWLEFLVRRVFEPRGHAVEGDVWFRGEDFDDMGVLSVHDGAVTMNLTDRQPNLSHAELMAGADALNAYYRAVEENGIDRTDTAMTAAEQVVDSYEQLLSDYAEETGCYTEWDKRRCKGLAGA